MTKGYPKRLNVPLDEVLARRNERKRLRSAKIPKPIKHKHKDQKGMLRETFRIPKDRKDVFEWHGSAVRVRDVRNANGNTVTMHMPKIELKYLDWFLTNLVFRFDRGVTLFPNVKEQSESVAAMFATRKHVKDHDKCFVIVVADGSTPRTGYLMAPYAKQVISVDPAIHERWTVANDVMPSNLIAVKATIQDFLTKCLPPPPDTPIVIVAVHAHVELDAYLPRMREHVTTVIAIPCCVPQHTAVDNFKTIASEDDYGIMSPCRRILVWQKTTV